MSLKRVLTQHSTLYVCTLYTTHNHAYFIFGIKRMDYLPEEGKGQFECLVIIIIILGVFGYQLVEVYVGGGQVSLM